MCKQNVQILIIHRIFTLEFSWDFVSKRPVKLYHNKWLVLSFFKFIFIFKLKIYKASGM